MRAMKRGGSSGNTVARASVTTSAKLVRRDPVPDVEEEAPTGLEHAPRFPIALHLVGEEHDPELARHDIECSILERQGERVRLPPGDPPIIGLPRRRMIQHGLVEVGRQDPRARGKHHGKRAGQHAGAGGGFQDIVRLDRGHPRREVARIRLEDERNQEAVVDFRDRSREHPVASRQMHLRERGRVYRRSAAVQSQGRDNPFLAAPPPSTARLQSRQTHSSRSIGNCAIFTHRSIIFMRSPLRRGLQTESFLRSARDSGGDILCRLVRRRRRNLRGN
jgi:hypothetical protein